MIVESFLAEGASVSYCARTVHGAEFSRLSDVNGGDRAVGTAVNLAELDSIEEWVQKSAERFGQINVVVANGNTLRKCSHVMGKLTKSTKLAPILSSPAFGHGKTHSKQKFLDS